MPLKYIVIIDDDEEFLFLLKCVLKAEGYSVKSFSNPETALIYIKKEFNKIDLIITDVLMPVLNGYLLVLLIKKITFREPTKIILLTSTSQLIGNVSLNVDVNKIIHKPITPLEVIGCLRAI